MNQREALIEAIKNEQSTLLALERIPFSLVTRDVSRGNLRKLTDALIALGEKEEVQ